MTITEISQIAEPILMGIKTKMTETYGVSVLSSSCASNIVVLSVVGPDYVCFNIEQGLSTPAYTSAPGKAMLAHLPDSVRRRTLPHLSFKKLTPNTILTTPALEKEFAKIRRQGYAVDNEEEKIGVRCGGIAVLDKQGRPICAVWISGLAKRLTDKHFLSQVRTLQAVASRLQEKFNDLQSRRQQLPPFIKKAIARLSDLSDGAQNADLSGEELAHFCGTSYSTLRSSFTREVGMPPAHFRLQVRLNEACRLLREDKLSVTSISEKLGFCSQKYFSGLFKRKFGVAPKDFCQRKA